MPKQPTPTDITTFFRQLATLISAGVPIVETLTTLTSAATKPTLQQLITQLRNELQKGSYLSETLQLYPEHFTPFTIQLVRLGEHTGTLDTILLTLADHHENQQTMQRKIKHALFYPAIISISATLMLITMFTFIIPRFAELFADSQQHLPLLTRSIFKLSDLIHQSFPFISIACILLLLLLRYTIPTQPLLKFIVTHTPYLRTCQHKIILARFSRQLSLCLKSGLPIIDSLRLVIEPDKHPDFAYYIYHIRNQLNAGQSLHTAISQHTYFPPLMQQMIKTGDETGKIDMMLDKIAELYEADTDYLLQQLGQLFEPLIMIILGVLIGGLVIGMYLPIFQLGNTL